MPFTYVYRHLCRLGLFLLPLIAAPLLQLRAQEEFSDIMVGVGADLTFQYQTVSIPVFSGSADCGLFEHGWETGTSLGARFMVPTLFGNRFGVSGSLMLSAAGGRLAVTAPEAFVLYDSQLKKSVSAEHEYRLETKIISLKLDAMLSYAVSSNIRILFGPSFGYCSAATVNQVDYMTDPVYRFVGGEQQQYMGRGNDLVPERLMFGGHLGISYEIEVGKDIVFIPEILLRSELTPLFQGFDRRAIGPGIGFTIMNKLQRTLNDPDTTLAAIPIAEVPLPDTTIPAPRPLQASINLYSVDEEGKNLPWAQIRILETLRRDSRTGGWQTERKTEPPVLIVEPDYTSTAGVKEWKIVFRYGGDLIGTSSSKDEEKPASIDWKIMDDAISDSTRLLTAEFTVVDSANATVRTTDQIPLKIERLCRIVDNQGDSMLYTLFPSSADSTLLAENLHVLKDIAQAALKNGRRIEVVGLTGNNTRTPLPDSTRKERIEEVADKLVEFLGEEGQRKVSVHTTIRRFDPTRYSLIPKQMTTYPELEIVVR